MNDKQKNLRDMLRTTAGDRVIPMHMPGHKRNIDDNILPWKYDVTEVGDFDDLHHPTGVLKRLGERIAALYGGDVGFPLVGGSTCGILAGIYAAVPMGGVAVAAANCHKSVTNGLLLRNARISFINPDCRNMIFSAVTSDDVECAIEENPEASLVIITSPTYEGETSDIAAIADVCHRYGAALMVDCAHGAHFGYVPGCPDPPSRLGADITVMSLHKTLPSLTQTAVAVLSGDKVSVARFAEGLGIFESSSPSYPLLASIEECVDFMERPDNAFEAFSERLDDFYRRTAAMKHLHVILPMAGSRDKARITILSNCPGVELYRRLESDYSILCEMAGAYHVIAIPSVCDSDSALRSFADALTEIDESLDDYAAPPEHTTCPTITMGADSDAAAFAPFEAVPWSEAKGRIAAASCFAYPPGIPLTLPGSVITEETIRAAMMYIDCGITPENTRHIDTDGVLCVK